MTDTPQFALGSRAALEAAANIARIRAEQHADMALNGEADSARPREAMEAAFSDMRWAILALPVPSLRDTLDLDAGMDAFCAEMGKNEPGVPNWREFNAAQQDTLRSVLRAGILAALGVTE